MTRPTASSVGAGAASSSSSNSSAAKALQPHAILFLDNGGDTIKAMYLPSGSDAAASSAARPRFLVLPNCVGFSSASGLRLIGSQISELPHYHSFVVQRPIGRGGALTQPALQAEIWEYVLQHFGISRADEPLTELWLTVPLHGTYEEAEALRGLVSDRFRFAAVVPVSASFLALVAHEQAAGPELAPGKRRRRDADDTADSARVHRDGEHVPHLLRAKAGCGVVVDVGFSGTTVVPYLDYAPVGSSVTRLDVGGKVLTNRLKEYLSYTQTDLTQDGWLVSHIKEQQCAVQTEWRHTRASSAQCEQEGSVPYYLPTIPLLYPLGCEQAELDRRLADAADSSRHRRTQSRRGHGAEESANEEAAASPALVDKSLLPALQLGRARMAVPELLFTPADLGVQQMGLVQSIFFSTLEKGLLARMPMLARRLLAGGVCVFGGSSQFPGFVERLDAELRQSSRTINAVGVLPYGSALAMQTNREDTDAAAPDAAAFRPLHGAWWLLTSPRATALRTRVRDRTLCNFVASREASTGEIHDAMLRML